MSEDISHEQAMKVLDILYDMTYELTGYSKDYFKTWYKVVRGNKYSRTDTVRYIWNMAMEEYFGEVLDVVKNGSWEDIVGTGRKW